MFRLELVTSTNLRKDGKMLVDGMLTLVETEQLREGTYNTWWGEKINLRLIADEGMKTLGSGFIEVDLRAARSIREASSGRKGWRKFVRKIDNSSSGSQRLNSRMSLIWRCT